MESIVRLDNRLFEAFKGRLHEPDRDIDTLVDNADAEGLMEFGFQLQQALEI